MASYDDQLDDELEDEEDLFGPGYDLDDESDRHRACPAGDCDDPACCCQNRMCRSDNTRYDKRIRAKRVSGRDLPASAFAYAPDTGRSETWALPCHDAKHCEESLKRCDKTPLPDDLRAQTYVRIMRRCQKFGVAGEQKSASGDFERRVGGVELRAVGGSSDADPLRLEGYAAVFNTYAQMPTFREKVNPAAFNSVLDQNQDVRCLFNHDKNQVFGRTTNQSLKLSVDQRGLRYVCFLPNTQAARDMHTSVSRGDINQCSFSFSVTPDGQKWTEERDADGTPFLSRELTSIHTLLDVGPVAFPVYETTTVSARSLVLPSVIPVIAKPTPAQVQEVADDSRQRRKDRLRAVLS